jgi:hypothetical protein
MMKNLFIKEKTIEEARVKFKNMIKENVFIISQEEFLPTTKQTDNYHGSSVEKAIEKAKKHIPESHCRSILRYILI